MKYPATQFKSLAAALKEIEPFVRNGQHLQTGKPFERFGGMRSREIFGELARLRCDERGDRGKADLLQRSNRRRWNYL